LGEPPREKRRDWPKEKLKVQRQLHDRHVALNEALEKNVFRPRATYIIAGRSWIFGVVPDDNVRCVSRCISEMKTIGEADGAMSLVRLAETGDLGKIRLCETCKERRRVADNTLGSVPINAARPFTQSPPSTTTMFAPNSAPTKSP
jgi:hypothetical protein